ncbi:MAG: hypothetical protein C0404_11215 [Verrucomicrobia bacterium]|nr:hypothetical protein [Verrucomicrobiota bacterium]
MSASEIIGNLIPELVAIRSGQCIWCQRGKPHPDYSKCPSANRPTGVNRATNTARMSRVIVGVK